MSAAGRERIRRSITQRRGQKQFRDTLIVAYGARCAHKTAPEIGMRCSLRDRGRPPGRLDLQRLHHNHILDAALARLAMRGRVVLCGGIANYNATEPPPGRKNYLNLIVQRGRMEGFIILDYMPRAAEAIGALAGWLDEGKLKTKVDTQHGLENARETLRRLFEGPTRASSCCARALTHPSVARCREVPGRGARASRKRLSPR
jgi:hypothetical protein